mmetsp:Transcript_78212/g.138509  ORF Transcript_78212/g.138509 Transcript_78212/m.138509 type:complete len:417 (+) Transcript_78212:83-1333(+)
MPPGVICRRCWFAGCSRQLLLVWCLAVLGLHTCSATAEGFAGALGPGTARVSLLQLGRHRGAIPAPAPVAYAPAPTILPPSLVPTYVAYAPPAPAPFAPAAPPLVAPVPAPVVLPPPAPSLPGAVEAPAPVLQPPMGISAPAPPLVPPVSQTPPPTIVSVQDRMEFHVDSDIAQLRMEAIKVANMQAGLLKKAAFRKQQEGVAIIQKELSAVTEERSNTLADDAAAHEKLIEEVGRRSTAAARVALEESKDEAETAAKVSVIHAVRSVETQAEQEVTAIANNAGQMIEEAGNLTKQVKRASAVSDKAATNAATWVGTLPREEAAHAVSVAKAAESMSMEMRKEAANTERIAKLAGNIALNSLKTAEEATARETHAKELATQAAEQAAQNALVLTTILKQAEEARDASVLAVAKVTG